MSEQTAHLVERLRARLHRLIRRSTLANLAFGLVLTGGIAVAFWLTSAVVEASLWLAPTPRSILTGGAVFLIAGFGLYFLGRPLLHLTGLLPRLSEEAAARRVGHHHPEVGDRLVNLLQLASGRRSSSTGSLVDHAVASLGHQVDPVPFEKIEDFGRARRASRWAALPIAGLLIFLLAAPSTFWSASGRLLAPTRHFQRPAPFRLSITPEKADLVKGDSLTLTVEATGRSTPRTVTLQMQNSDEEHVRDIKLSTDDGGAFRHIVKNVRQDFRYRAHARPVRTDWHQAAVTDRPRVRRLQVRLVPPSYTGRPARRLDPNVGDVTALPGTKVQIDARLAGPRIRRALLRFDDGSADTLAVTGRAAKGSFVLRREGSYHLTLLGAEEARNADPIRYRMNLTADAAPTITFLAPAAETNLSDDLRAQLRMRLSDDFGFARLRLYYRLSKRRYGEPMTEFAALDLPLQRPRLLDQEVIHDWLLTRRTDLDPVPGDVIEYYVKVWDNDAVADYKSARTATQRLRLPSMAEKYEALDEQQTGVEKQLESLSRQRQAVGEQFDDLRRKLRRKQKTGWEERRELENLQKDQKKLEQGVEELSRQLDQTVQQMQKEGMVSPETVKKYQELQEVAREINSPELEKVLKKLQESMQKMDRRQMQQALQNFEFNQQQYQQRLERTMELFKRLRAQQKLEEAARRAGELAKQEEKLAEETQKLEDGENEGKKGEGEKVRRNEGKNEGKKGEGKEGEEKKEKGEREKERKGEGERGRKGEKDDGAEKSSQQKADDRQQTADSGQQRPERKRRSTPGVKTAKQREQMARQQERNRAATKKLEKQIEKLSSEMQDTQGAPRKKMQQLSEEMRRQQLPRKMQQNSQQMRQGQLEKARQGQKQMQKRLQQMQKRLQQMQKSMQGRQRQINLSGLQQALANTLKLSEEQEALRRQVRGLAPDSPTLRQYTQQQATLAEGLRTTSDSLQQLARQIPKMTRAVQEETGKALREMKQATEAMTDRTAQKAGGHQTSSMMHLNELALLLSDLMNQMQNGQGGGGMSTQQMMQSLQQMSGQQKKLNAQIQQFLNDIQGQRLSQSQAKRLQQIARQQEALKKQLRKMRRQGADRQVMGDLERIAEQMEETVRELQQQRINRRTTERQRQILTRLLNAQKALRKRGKDRKRRQGQEADGDYTRERPAELSPQEETDRLRRALIRALESGYTADYEELIKRYFKLLEQQQTPQQQQD